MPSKTHRENGSALGIYRHNSFERGSFRRNPVCLVWEADFAAYKNRICLLLLVLRSTQEAAVEAEADFRAAEPELPSSVVQFSFRAKVSIKSPQSSKTENDKCPR
jgi:hypothetical protein